MKKYLLAVCFMALVQIAFGSDQHNMYSNDSIIVEFGKSGKIVLVVNNKEDFDKLKEMDVNQIIKELDLQENEETGDVTVVEIRHKDGKKEILRVYEGEGETEVTLGRFRVIVDESGHKTNVKVESTRKKQTDPPFRTYFNFDLGINNYFEDGNFPGGNAPHAVKGWGSWNVGFNWMASQKLSKGLYWDFGLGVQWYNFKLDDPRYQAIGTENGVEFLERTDVNGFKSKISASYLTVQSLFKLDFGKLNDSGRNGMRLGIGPYAGYRIGGRSKFVYRDLDGSGRRKDKTAAGSYLNNFRYGVRGEVGFRSITFFTTYDFNELLQKNMGPSLNPITFGLVF